MCQQDLTYKGYFRIVCHFTFFYDGKPWKHDCKTRNNILFVYFSTRQIASTVDGHVNKTKNTNLTFTLLKTIRSDRCLHVLTNRMFDKRL